MRRCLCSPLCQRTKEADLRKARKTKIIKVFTFIAERPIDQKNYLEAADKNTFKKGQKYLYKTLVPLAKGPLNFN